MKKKLLVLTSVIVVVLAVVGFWGYNTFFRVNPKVKQQLYHQFGTNFFNTFPDSAGGNNSAALGGVTGQGTGVTGSGIGVKPGDAAKSGAGADPGAAGSTAPFDSSRGSARGLSASIGSGSGDPSGGVPGGTSGGSASGNPNSSPGSGAPSLTVAGVVGQYLPEIHSLQSVALSRLDTLYAAAVQEYQEDKAAGTLNRAALAQKYIQAGNLLEANVDSRFYGIIGSLQSELVADGLPTDEVGVIKSQYEAAKAARRSAILSKALRGR